MPSARDRAEKRSKELGQSKYWKMAVGDNYIRILPTPASKKGNDDLFFEFNVHENVGKDKKWLRCGKDASGKGKCYLCDKVIPSLRKKGKESRAAALEPKPKMAVQIALVNEKKGTMTGPEMWLPSPGLQRGLLARIFGNKKKDYTDAKKGYNMTYKRVGTGKNDTEYFGPDINDDRSAVDKSIMKKLKAFDETKKLPLYSESEQKKAYQGIDDDSSSEESGSESSSASSSESSSSSESASESASGSASSSASESSSESSSSSSAAEEHIDLDDEDKGKKKKATKKKGKGKKASSSESASESGSESEESGSES